MKLNVFDLQLLSLTKCIFIHICICIWFDWKEKDNKQCEIEYYENNWNKTLPSFAGSW